MKSFFLVCPLSLVFLVSLVGSVFGQDQPLSENTKITGKLGLSTYLLKCRDEAKEFYVYIPKNYDGIKKLPLVVSSHGNGGSGQGEIAQWTRIADENGWIVACPTFLSCSGKSNCDAEAPMLKEVMERLFRSLEIDRKNVLFTGFSAGGNITWYMAAKMDKDFTALCTRSGNYNGEIDGLDLHPWRNRPIYVFWGGNSTFNADNGQGQEVVSYLEKKIHAKRLKFETIAGGGHDSRPDLVADWFLTVVQDPPL